MTVSHAILEKDTWGVGLEPLCAVVLLFAITVPNTCTREYLNDFWVTVYVSNKLKQGLNLPN